MTFDIGYTVGSLSDGRPRRKHPHLAPANQAYDSKARWQLQKHAACRPTFNIINNMAKQIRHVGHKSSRQSSI